MKSAGIDDKLAKALKTDQDAAPLVQKLVADIMNTEGTTAEKLHFANNYTKGFIDLDEGESLEEIKAKLKPKKASISMDMLDTANSYDDKVVLMRLLVQEDESRVAAVLRNMMKST